MMRLLAALAFLALGLAGLARAEEQITSFDVDITVEQDGDILVTEKIAVISEGRQIRRGIYRTLPRYYETGEGERFLYDYNLKSVTRDGRKEKVERLTEGNAMTWRIGDADVFLDDGPHVYELVYEVKNQIRYFEDYDELYWNATGNYWNFPIMASSATVHVPSGASITQLNAYTGSYGEAEAAYTASPTSDGAQFSTTRPLTRGEGLTISVSLAKGAIDPPSMADKSALNWQRYGAMSILFAGIVGVFSYLYTMWTRVGRDPAKLPVFPRYEPPEGYSPAAAHHVYFRGFRGKDALIATVMNLAVKGYWEVDVDKKITTLTSTDKRTGDDVASDELALRNDLAGPGDSVTFGKSYSSSIASAFNGFTRDVAKAYGSQYFKWNAGHTVVGVVLSVIVILVAMFAVVNWSAWHLWLILGLVALNLAFLYFMPAPTRKGRESRSAIAGFRLYLETAEKLRLNSYEVGQEQPPPMSKELYERFLPYAIALGVEKPWTKHFEKALPDEARDYHPAWGHFGSGRSFSAADINRSLVSGMAAGVATASTAPSSSSGSSGGGFSGGGGGGGGGGGW